MVPLSATRRFTALLLMSLALASRAQDFSKIEIRAQKLNDTTWMLQGAGGNIGLSIGDDAVFVAMSVATAL